MIVLDCPAQHINDPFIQKTYIKLLALKINGYRTAEEKYLAVDESDIYATHFIVGEQKEDHIDPVISFKALTQKRCEEWNRPFNATAITQKSNSKDHLNSLMRIIEECKNNKEDFGYTASLAVSPFLKDKTIKEKIIEMFLCMLARFHTDFEIKKSMCVGRVKVKSPEVLKRIGYYPITLNGEELSSLRLPQYLNNEYIMLVLHKISEEGEKIIEKYRTDWESRLVYPYNGNNQPHTNIPDLQNERKKAS